MSDADKILGKLEEFHRAQIQANDDNSAEHRDMMQKIEDINAWRWRIEGKRLLLAGVSGILGGAIASAVLTLVIKHLST